MFRRFRTNLLVILIGCGFSPGPSFGQSDTVPLLGRVFPPGATIGRTQEWMISGRNLGKINTLRISGGGVEVSGLTIRGEDQATVQVRVFDGAEPGYREIRVDGPTGVSNLALVRLDRLPSSLEIEPNDEPGTAQEIEPGVAVSGVLKALDVDHFRLRGRPGQRLTIDLEARRLGTAISPVMTLTSSSGAGLAQGRESRAEDHDCRISTVLPPDGICRIEVRDNLYGGDDRASYRLRVDPLPFATGLFPIGGPKGRSIEVEVSGGSLDRPVWKTITLPDRPGSVVEAGAFDGVSAPMRLLVGDGPESIEPPDRPVGVPFDLTEGVAVQGRISRPGEVDSYRLAIKAGEKYRVRVAAAAMGSWLDSVVSIVDEAGAILAENDDAEDAARPPGVAGLSPDSSVDFEARADGFLTIQVADRFGDGGPEYPYRLAIGRDRPDFAMTLFPGNGTAGDRTAAGRSGAFNLSPGSTATIPFLLRPEGRPGTIEVRVEGLPEGVTAEPVRIRFRGPSSKIPFPSDPVVDFLRLKVARGAPSGFTEIRVVATAFPFPGSKIVREASARVGIDPSGATSRPITRILTRFPLRVFGEGHLPPKVGEVSEEGNP